MPHASRATYKLTGALQLREQGGGREGETWHDIFPDERVPGAESPRHKASAMRKQAYAIREYLTLDPVGAFMSEHGRGWRLHDGVYHSWLPNDDGRWRSQEIAATIGMEGLHATVYPTDGRRQLRESEVARELAWRDAEITRQAEELAVLRRLVERRTGDGATQGD